MQNQEIQCGFKDCDAPAKARGWCSKHWTRWWKHGDPSINKIPRRGLGKCSESQKRIKARYRQKNREKLRIAGRAYAKKNRERANEWRRTDKLKNREKYRIASRIDCATRRTRNEAIKRDYSAEDILKLRHKQKNRCPNCRRELIKYHIDHIMPLAKGGLNVFSNIQLLCPPCNQRKWAKHPIDWARENGRLL